MDATNLLVNINKEEFISSNHCLLNIMIIDIIICNDCHVNLKRAKHQTQFTGTKAKFYDNQYMMTDPTLV